MKTNHLGPKSVILLTSLFLLSGFFSASAQAVFNANNGNISFLAANKIHKVGTNGSGVGNVTLYTNVITIAGQQIDCIIRTVSLTNGSFALPASAQSGTIPFDYSSPTGSGLSANLDRFFSPMLTFNSGGGSAKFKFEFIFIARKRVKRSDRRQNLAPRTTTTTTTTTYNSTQLNSTQLNAHHLIISSIAPS